MLSFELLIRHYSIIFNVTFGLFACWEVNFIETHGKCSYVIGGNRDYLYMYFSRFYLINWIYSRSQNMLNMFTNTCIMSE